MKAKYITIETCEGSVSLVGAQYTIPCGDDDLIHIKVSFTILDHDVKKKYAIIKTQMLTGRFFQINEGGKGCEIVFEYPYYLVTSAKF